MEILAVVATVLATLIAGVALWFQIAAHGGGKGDGGGVTVSVAIALPSWGDRVDWFVSVKAYNGGERPVIIEGWGFDIPDGGSLIQVMPVPWSTALPYKLEPGDKAEFYMPEAGLRASLAERNLRFNQTKSWVRLASDQKVYGPPAPVAD